MTIAKTIDSSVLDSYMPPGNIDELNAMLKHAADSDDHKIIVLDDDPTGVQTVHDVSVYTDWLYESILNGFKENSKLFYILTNSRAFTEEQTQRAHAEIGSNIAAAAKACNRRYIIVSRGDSTLRGHYPLETQILHDEAEKAGCAIDGEILCPYFKEGGRFTIDDVHYVKYGDELVPAGETEFAGDKTFGYKSSNLADYIEEKTGGAYRADDVVSIGLDELRAQDFDGICRKLCAVSDFGKVIVNAVDACDLKVFAIAFYRALNKGHNFIFRTAAGMVKELGAISDKALLTRSELIAGGSTRGGIVVVGSHTKKTTAQLESLRGLSDLEFIEFNSDLVLDDEAFKAEIESVLKREEDIIKSGKTAVVYTKRKLLSLKNDTKEKALLRSVKISDAVQSLVGRLNIEPAFVVAKGGITSSDVGTKALRVRKARVMGQIQPGIPVWQTDESSRFPHIPYVIFPGNVGEADTLKKVMNTLLGR